MKGNQNNDGNDHHHLFDFIAGTSIGAIDGAILVAIFSSEGRGSGQYVGIYIYTLF